MRGRVKWFNIIKGFGFIEIDKETDAIVHHSQIDKEKEGYKFLFENDIVEFDLIITAQGHRAENVHKIFLEE